MEEYRIKNCTFFKILRGKKNKKEFSKFFRELQMIER